MQNFNTGAESSAPVFLLTARRDGHIINKDKQLETQMLNLET